MVLIAIVLMQFAGHRDGLSNCADDGGWGHVPSEAESAGSDGHQLLWRHHEWNIMQCKISSQGDLPCTGHELWPDLSV